MPIYEYTCDACGRQTDALQRFSDPPLTDCPSCGKPALRRLISLSSFHLKGSGWYATDYAGKNGSNGKNGKAAEKSDAAGAEKSEKTPEKAAEKPDAKPESKSDSLSSASPAASSSKD
jgi:putative FmdB family regulatory protein